MKKKNLYVFLHGNPGSEDDFNALEKSLKIGLTDTVICQARPRTGAVLKGLIAQIEAQVEAQQADRVYVIAYSWGAYFAARWFESTGREPDSLVLISPTMVVENELSGASLALAKTPLVGKLLLNKLSPSLAAEFLKKSFAPQVPEDFDAGKLAGLLNDPLTWKGAMIYKYQQQVDAAAKFKPELAAKMLVVHGSDDSSTDWSIQRTQLFTSPPARACSTMEITGGGHALPWTHADALAKAMSKHLANRRRLVKSS